MTTPLAHAPLHGSPVQENVARHCVQEKNQNTINLQESIYLLKTIVFTAIAALLGACSTTAPPQDSASVNTSGNYVVVQDGTTYTMQTAYNSTSGGVSVDAIRVGASGSETAFGFSNADVTAVGGKAGGTYITGLSGTQTVGMATSGPLNLAGNSGLMTMAPTRLA